MRTRSLTFTTAALFAGVLLLLDSLQAASTVQFAAATYEVNKAAGSITIPVTRTAPFDSNAGVRVVVEGGTAEINKDFKWILRCTTANK